IAAAAVAVGFALVAMLWRRTGEQEQQDVDFRNPFGFWSVIELALFLSAIILLGRSVRESFGARSAIVGAVVIGLTDIDSVTISIAQLTPHTLTFESAAYAILAAVVSNTASKIAIEATIGRGRFAMEIAAMAVLCLAASAIVLAITLAVMPG